MTRFARALEALRRRVVAPLELSGRGTVTPSDIFGPEQLALYVHLPFCGSLCPYCVFNKNRAPEKMAAYVAALEREIAWHGRRRSTASTPIHAIFFGGGTPSFLPAALIERVLEGIARELTLAPGVQITLEANPDSTETQKLRRYRAAGVNRISVGAQSFDSRFLKQLGRRYRPEEIGEALARVRDAGIAEQSIDLMFGLPGQTPDDFAAELDQAIASTIGHLSLFPMLYRPGTPLWKRRVTRRPLYRMYAHAVAELARHGFRQYTAEDFTRSGIECRYQAEVWRTGTKGFLGLGAGAYSVYGSTGWYNVGDLDAYIAATRHGLPIAGGGSSGPRERMIEHLMSAAKNLQIEPALFEERFAQSIGSVVGPLPYLLRAARLLRRDDDGSLRVTTRGAFYTSLLWGELVLRQLAEAGAATAVASCSKSEQSESYSSSPSPGSQTLESSSRVATSTDISTTSAIGIAASPSRSP